MAEPAVADVPKQQLLALSEPQVIDQISRLGMALTAAAPVFLLALAWWADDSERINRIVDAGGLVGLLAFPLLPGLVSTALATVGYVRLAGEHRVLIRAMPAAVAVWGVMAALFVLYGLRLSTDHGLSSVLRLAPFVLSVGGWLVVMAWSLARIADEEAVPRRTALTVWGLSLGFETLMLWPTWWWADSLPAVTDRALLIGLIVTAAIGVVANVVVGFRLMRTRSSLRPLPRWAGLVNQLAIQPWILVMVIWQLAFALVFSWG